MYRETFPFAIEPDIPLMTQPGAVNPPFAPVRARPEIEGNCARSAFERSVGTITDRDDAAQWRVEIDPGAGNVLKQGGVRKRLRRPRRCAERDRASKYD